MDTLLRYEKLLNHLHATNNRKHLRLQLGHMVNQVDVNRLDNDNAYKKLYNRIRLKYANMNTRFNTLTRIEKMINRMNEKIRTFNVMILSDLLVSDGKTPFFDEIKDRFFMRYDMENIRTGGMKSKNQREQPLPRRATPIPSRRCARN